MRLPWEPRKSADANAVDELALDDGDDLLDDVAPQRRKKEKIQAFSRRSAQSARTTMKGILRRKVFINEARAEYIRAMWADVCAGAGAVADASDGAAGDWDLTPATTPADGPTRVLLLNFTPEQVARAEAALEGAIVRAETIAQRHWVTLMHTTRPKFLVPCSKAGDPLRRKAAEGEGSEPDGGEPSAAPSKGSTAVLQGGPPQVVVLRLTGELTEFDECCIAAHWMSSRVVIPFIDLPAAKRDAQAALLQQAVEYTGCTWPVIEDLAALEAYCTNEVRPILTMQQHLAAHILEQTRRWGNVNYVWHGCKRAPLAFVPFGVSAVNFVGLSRLVGRVLSVTGMLQDTQAKKAAIGMAAQQYAKTFILDETADVYQFIVSSSVVASLTLAVSTGATWTAALSALSLADAALLGSVALVTGVVAAIGAAITRSQMVQALAVLVAFLQTLWLLFPPVRRSDSEHVQLSAEEQLSAERLERIAFEGGQPVESAEVSDDAALAALELLPDIEESGSPAQPAAGGDGAAGQVVSKRSAALAWAKSLVPQSLVARKGS